MYVEILDGDTITSNDLVDLLLIDHNQTVEQPLHQNHTGMYNFVTMDLTITVFCAENFTGPDCNEIDHCSGVSCGDNKVCRNVVNRFQCTCSPGFTGVLCETNIDDCVGVDCTGNGQYTVICICNYIQLNTRLVCVCVCVCVYVCVFRELSSKVFVLVL